VARVRVDYVGRAPLEGSDDGLLMATLRHGEPAPPPSSSILLASTKPFLPMLRGGVGMVRGPIPLPPDRPFTLGEGDARPDPRPASDRTSMRDVRAVETARLQPPAFSAVPAISAYAPVRSRMSVAPDAPYAIMTGRGLY
jgi:rare lipoprotein A